MEMPNIAAEVRDYIEARLAAREVIRVEWLTHEIVARHDGIDGDDLPFYRVCAYAHVKDVVKRAIGRYEVKPTTAKDVALPGFDHLQSGYTMDREGDRVLVPTDLLSDDELLSRAAELDDMAKGCLAHAQEIRKFVRMRAGEAA